MDYLPNVIFAIALLLGIGFFVSNVLKLLRNIKLGKDLDRSDNKPERWKNMAIFFHLSGLLSDLSRSLPSLMFLNSFNTLETKKPIPKSNAIAKITFGK